MHTYTYIYTQKHIHTIIYMRKESSLLEDKQLEL